MVKLSVIMMHLDNQ